MFDFVHMTDEELEKKIDEEELESDVEEENIRWDSRDFIRPDETKIDCKDCAHQRYNPCSAYCSVFRAPKGKPAPILWGNMKCAYKISHDEANNARKQAKKLAEKDKKKGKKDE